MLATVGHMIRTRAARDSDHGFLKQLHHRAYREVVTRQFGTWVESDQDAWFEQGLREAQFRIVEQGKVAIGAIGAHTAQDHVYLAELQILPEFQNQGIGGALLVAELERARALGLPVRLRVLRQNRARKLYERHGFEVTGETETHYLLERAAVDVRA